jgi:hypothetical protein
MATWRHAAAEQLGGTEHAQQRDNAAHRLHHPAGSWPTLPASRLAEGGRGARPGSAAWLAMSCRWRQGRIRVQAHAVLPNPPHAPWHVLPYFITA